MLRWAVLSSLLVACDPPPGPINSPRPVSVREDPRELGDARVIVQGRLALGPRGHKPESWLDIEVNGPGRDALAVCNLLLDHERDRLSHVDTNIGVQIERACSDDALAPPDLVTPFALLNGERMDAVLLALELGPDAAGKKLDALSVQRRFLSGFSDEKACRAALDRLHEAAESARTEARDQAKAFLVDELAKQRQAEQAACGSDPKSGDCERARTITGVLEKKLAESDTPSGSDSGPSTGSCFRR